MEFVRTSDLHEYAAYFWRHQVIKLDPGDNEAIADLRRGGDPLQWMRIRHSYKLPDEAASIEVWRLEQVDVESLLIPAHIVNDHKMREYNLLMEPPTTSIRDIANAAISRGFFDKHSNTAMFKRYSEWSVSRTIRNTIMGDEMTLIKRNDQGQHVIVDGWGRFLAFVSLLIMGFEFYPVESFVSLHRR